MAFFADFEIDIRAALTSQLLGAFAELNTAPLSQASLEQVPSTPGVYQLYLDGTLVYVGKAEGSLSKRLGEHYEKISGRRNISIESMSFKCIHVNPSWTALAPETALIKYYKKTAGLSCEWNGNGFGPHDPGRERETTNKPPDGFDAKYPIKENWLCEIEVRDWECIELLKELKSKLPYLLRYQTDASKSWSKGHSDHRGLMITVPTSPMQMDALLRLVVSRLPGWQATAFPSHVILYKERRAYTHGHLLETVV